MIRDFCHSSRTCPGEQSTKLRSLATSALTYEQPLGVSAETSFERLPAARTGVFLCVHLRCCMTAVLVQLPFTSIPMLSGST